MNQVLDLLLEYTQLSKDLINIVIEYADETWLYREFGLCTKYLENLNLVEIKKKNKNSWLSHLSLSAQKMDYVVEYRDNGSIDSYSEETLKNILVTYDYILDNDDEKDPTEIINSLTKDETYDYLLKVIEGEYDDMQIHPQGYPVSYLLSGILYDDNWEHLTTQDLDKFVLSYGINMNLSYNQKIIEIVKCQNGIFQELLDAGITHECRGCHQIKELIQIVDGNKVGIDISY